MTMLPERIESGEVEAPDVFCGGTPCQAFSIAGKRNSLSDARGNLSLVFCEIADAIDAVRLSRDKAPAIVFWENVPGVLSTSDNAFGCFLAGLAGDETPLTPEACPPAGKSSRYWKWNKATGSHSLSWPVAGCVVGPARTVAWRVTDAKYFGVAQRRRRVFVVASARKGFDPATILFEFDGVRRDTAPSRESGEGTTAGTLRSTDGGSDVDHAISGHVLPITMAHGQGGAEIGFDRGPTLTCNHEAPIAAYSSKLHNTSSNQSGKFYKEYTTGLEANSPPPAVIYANAGEFGSMKAVAVSDPLRAKGGDTGNGGESLVCVHGTQDPCTDNNLAFSLGRNSGQENAIAFTCKDYGADAGELSPTLQAANNGSTAVPAVQTSMQVRRLTPVECERLQGFLDNYTMIPWGKESKYPIAGGVSVQDDNGVWHHFKPTPDGPRYKALGNSWAVPNVRWIGQRIDDHVFGDLLV